MPPNAGRSHAVLYDQFEDDQRFGDWGADDLFTRMPRARPRAVADDTRRSRVPRPLVAVVDTPAPRVPRPRIVDAARPARLSASARRTARSARPADGERRTARSTRPADGERRTARSTRPADGERRTARSTRPADTQRSPQPRALELVGPPAERRGAPAGGASRAPIDPPTTGTAAKVITGHPGSALRPLPIVPAPRRRPARTVGDWIGARPERIVAWAFMLGLLLVLIAISTADAATA